MTDKDDLLEKQDMNITTTTNLVCRLEKTSAWLKGTLLNSSSRFCTFSSKIL